MARRTTNKGFYVWDLATDLYDHDELAANWDLVDNLLAQAADSIKVITSFPASPTFGDVAITSGTVGGFSSGTMIRYDGSQWRTVGPIEVLAALPTSNNYQGRIVALSGASGEYVANDVVINTNGANTWAKLGGINIVSSVAASTNNYSGKMIILNADDNTTGSGGPYSAYDVLVYNSDTSKFEVLAGVPSGAIQMYGGTAAPKGWLLCDGTAYLQADYPTLYAAILTNYGAGSAGTFKVPDLRGRVPVGYAASGGSSEASLIGGNENLAANLRRPQHKHTISSAAHTHTHNMQQIELPTRYGYPPDHYTDLQWGNYLLNYRDQVTHVETIASGGPTLTVGASTSDSADAPPYLVINYIIKI